MSPAGIAPGVELVLAHHPIVTALPFVVPALLVVLFVAQLVWRDRRDERREREAGATGHGEAGRDGGGHDGRRAVPEPPRA